MKKTPENSLWILAFLLVGLAYFFGLFIDLTGDSGLYAAISRQMVESGDWFNLQINGELYDQKPHLFFWLAAAGIKLFGNTNFAFKLFPFVYGALGIYFTFRLGEQLFSAKAGKLAALIAGTSQIFFLYFFDFHTDTVLQTGVVLALWQLAAHLQSGKAQHFVLGFVGVGLAMFAKGPIGAVLPFFAVLLFLLAQRDYRQLFHPKWLLGAAISFAVVSPSLVHLYRGFGLKGIEFFFITNNFGRITGEYAGSSTDYFFYLHTLLWAFLPWTVFVATALFLEIKSWFGKKGKNIWGIYLLGSVLVLALILSIAKGKAPNYFLIAVPPIAVIAARWLTMLPTFPQKTQKRLLNAQMVLVSLLLVFFAFVVFLFRDGEIWGLVIFTLLFVIVSARLKFPEKPLLSNSLLVGVLVAGALNLFLNARVLPGLFAYQGARQVLALYEKYAAPNSQLYNFELEEYEMFFYAEDPVVQLKDWDELRPAMKKAGNWVYTNEGNYRDILKFNFAIDTVYEIHQRGMNKVNLRFLNPKTRLKSMGKNYLLVTEPDQQKRKTQGVDPVFSRSLKISPKYSNQVLKIGGDDVLEVRPEDEFVQKITVYLSELLVKNGFEVQLAIEFKSLSGLVGKDVVLVIALENEGKVLHYQSLPLESGKPEKAWESRVFTTRFQADFPKNAKFSMYVWNRGGQHFYVKKLRSIITSY